MSLSSLSATRRKTLHQGAPEPIAALNRVSIEEYSQPWELREPLVDIRNYCPDVVFAEHVCPFLRVRVADKLNVAQAALPTGYRLKIGTALRTLGMQQNGWNGYFKRMQEQHPDWPLSALRRATNKYHAPYDQKAPPGHCTGGAVDVGLLDPDGNALDMTAPTKGWEAANTWSDKISAESRTNRMIMVEAMLGAGFSNCRDEYWHYSWGDSAWAVRVGETKCPYGWAHPPVCLETDFSEASAAALQIESTRDVNGRVLHARGSFEPSGDAPRLPDGGPSWCLGLYWAMDVPVSLRFPWPTGLPAPEIFLRSTPDEIETLTTFCRDGESLLLEVTPKADRVTLSNYRGSEAPV